MGRGQGYFPIFMQLSGARALVVGGGKVALRKCRDLRAVGARVRAVAPSFCAGLKRLSSIECCERPFRARDVCGAAVVVAATDSPKVNERVAQEARKLGIPVNVVDKPALCTFILPAVLRRGPVVIAISTGGASPALARNLRDRISQAIPPRTGAHAAFLAATRGKVLKAIADPARRAAILERLAADDVAEILAITEGEARR